MCDVDNVQAVVGDLRNSVNSGKTRPISQRKVWLNAVLHLLEDHKAEWIDACAQDMQKPAFETDVLDLTNTLQEIRYLLKNLDNISGKQFVDKQFLTVFDSSYVKYDPFGVVLVISPWNYPIHLSMSPVVGAIAAGNAVILKPSELSPATTKLTRRLVHDYLPPDVVRVVEADAKGTSEILDKIHFDFIFFTGSPRVGRIVATCASKQLTPVCLELGGKSPVYIDDNVGSDLRLAARHILWGKYINCGQTCVAPDYVICSPFVAKRLIETMKDVLYREFEYGRTEADTQGKYCRLISTAAFDRLKSMLDSTGGNIVLGGKNFDRDARHMELTVVDGVNAVSDSTMQEEIFGPILPIVHVSSMDEAVSIVNAKSKALSLYLFTGDKKIVEYWTSNTSSGSVCVNDTIVQVCVLGLPFHGVGNSGMGPGYHAQQSFLTFSHAKSVLIRNRSSLVEFIGSTRYPPYTEQNRRYLDASLRHRPWLGRLLNFFTYTPVTAVSIVVLAVSAAYICQN